MPQKCIISGCQRIQRKNCGISFFRFPLKDKVLLEKWTTAVCETSSSVTASSIVCERHFKAEFISGKERKRLNKNAVPTEFLSSQIDPLQKLNDLINLYGQDKADCRENIVAIGANSNICDMDVDIKPNFTEDTVAIGANSNICDIDVDIKPNFTEDTVAIGTNSNICDIDVDIKPNFTEDTVAIGANSNICDIDVDIKPNFTEDTVAIGANSNICDIDVDIKPNFTEDTVAIGTNSNICDIDVDIKPNFTEDVIETHSNICDMDAHVALNLTEGIMHANKYIQSTNEDNPESQIKKLKTENKRLTTLIELLKDNHTKQLQNQADMFQHLLRKEKNVIKNKLTSAQNKIKLFNRQKQRLNVKIANILKNAKNKKILHEESYNILSEFETTFKYILQNKK